MLSGKEPGRWISGAWLRALGVTFALSASLVLAILVTPLAGAQTFSILYGFGRGADGRSPQAGLIWTPGGGLYGTTFLGGNPSCSCGTVFKLFPNGDFTVVHTFTGADGANPSAVLMADPKDNLYGTTSQGGAGGPGAGTVFKLAPPAGRSGSWTETVLYTFSGGLDGANPYAGVMQDEAGNLYGTTTRGGASGYGTVFEVDTTGKETVLYSFSGTPDGAYPYASMVRDTSGNLYGTTYEGGSANYGTVFKLDTTGKETVLHNFAGAGGGAYPNAGLTIDANGDFFGTTNEGGDTQSGGTIFKIDNTGIFTTLHTFTGGGDGASPESGVVMDSLGNLYGATNEGGDYDNDGTVFKLTQAGSLTTLHTFTAGGGGAYPYSALAIDPAGDLYGTTVGVGPYGNGVVYQLTAK
jgi:uncharacterized repeat protein (TIGR03803 family)